MSGCELCTLHPTTQWHEEHHEPFRFVILDCDSCDVAMAVVGEHRAVLDEREREVVWRALARVADRLYPQGWFYDDHMRQIPDHYHVHARPYPPGFAGREIKRQKAKIRSQKMKTASIESRVPSLRPRVPFGESGRAGVGRMDSMWAARGVDR